MSRRSSLIPLVLLALAGSATTVSAQSLSVQVETSLSQAQAPRPTEPPDTAIDRPSRPWSDGDTKPRITLRIYDFVGIDRLVLAGARTVTTEIFRQAGLEVLWLDCPVSDTDCDNSGEHPEFRLRIVPDAVAKDIVKGEVLGFAVPCAKNQEACLFYIFYSRVTDIAAKHGYSPDLILAHVIAHEIGHTLLGPNAHTLCGIMQASVPMTDMGRGSYFVAGQEKRLRGDLLERNREIGKRKER